jgi:signal transduction histidine kinase
MTWTAHQRRRSPREWAAVVVVLGGLLAFVVLVYAVLVLGGGLLLGRTSSADVGLSVLATAVVALAFDPVQSRLEVLASRLVHGGLPSPDDVLRRFSGTVAGRYAAEELPARMAQVLAEGTGAVWAQVWLVVGEQPTLAATWPPEAAAAAGTGERDPREGDAPGCRWLPVRHGGDLLGVLVVQEHPQVPLTSVEERLFSGLAGQAGLVLRGARLRAELEQRAVELAARAEELRRSRQRLVDELDAERRKLERDIHDGAQQHLVALAVNLRLAQTLADRSPERAGLLLIEQRRSAAEAIDTLVRLSRGIYPKLLTEHGLAAALAAATSTSPVPVELEVDGIGRYSARVEAAAYFCCLEALQNAAKHAGATAITVVLREDGARLVLAVGDDGSGFDPRQRPVGTGLASMRDRVESLDGTLAIDSTPLGTRVRATIPVTAGSRDAGT